MIEDERLITASTRIDEEAMDRAIRPDSLQDYVGQPAVREQMEIFIEAARSRGEALDHGDGGSEGREGRSGGGPCPDRDGGRQRPRVHGSRYCAAPYRAEGRGRYCADQCVGGGDQDQRRQDHGGGDAFQGGCDTYLSLKNDVVFQYAQKLASANSYSDPW